MKKKLLKTLMIGGTALAVAVSAGCSSPAEEPAADVPTRDVDFDSVELLNDIPRYDLEELFAEQNLAEPDKTFGMVIIDRATDPFAEQVELAETYADQLGWDFKLADLKGQVGNAGATLRTMIEGGVDVILMTSMGPDLVGRDALAAAAAAGVPVLSQTSGFNASASDGAFASTVESDLALQGRVVGEQMVADLPEGSKIALLFDEQSASGRILEENFREAIGDKFEIVAEKQYDYAKGVPGAQADASAMIQAHPDLAAIWCPFDGPCTGPANAVLASGNDIAIYSKGGYPALLDYIGRGVDVKTLAEPNTIKLLRGFDQAVYLTKGENVETDVFLELGGMITPENFEYADVIADGTVSYGPDLAERFYQRWGVG